MNNIPKQYGNSEDLKVERVKLCLHTWEFNISHCNDNFAIPNIVFKA